ncbi:response regulator transcription factor [Anaerosporobacter sp.]|uniref:response regulator transcription factor n=1 Tax=Anaerosporobacter sp. TaxID=1872529 RepID=UPI00286EC15A|nr:response regulator [Anaerosporobacter sp.]
MIKMIIADDESIILRGIRKLVDWNGLGIEIVGEYENGKAALTGILTEKPDLALLDINMPEMSGIDILKYIKNRDEIQTKVIFISGFQEFEYAKAAIKYGAAEYLLKPIVVEELLNAVEKIIHTIEREKNIQISETKENQDMSENYRKLAGVEQEKYITVYTEIIFGSEELPQVRKLVTFSFISFIEKYLEENNVGIVFKKVGDIVIILKEENISKAKELLYEISLKAEEVIGHSVAFIIGNVIDCMSKIPESYSACLDMKGYLYFQSELKNSILVCGEPVFHKKYAMEELEKEMSKIVEAALAMDQDSFAESFRKFATIVCNLSDGRKEDACYYFCNMIRFVQEKLQGMSLYKVDADMKNLLEIGRQTSSFTEMKEKYNTVVKEYMNSIGDSVKSQDKKEIIFAKQYIEQHYMDNLTLEVMAKELHMNPYYFSSYFKKNAGENFKDYLNQVRVNHALSLLITTDMKIYGIAAEVGFRDARSLTEAFQKVYKETPASYKKRVCNGESVE